MGKRSVTGFFFPAEVPNWTWPMEPENFRVHEARCDFEIIQKDELSLFTIVEDVRKVMYQWYLACF